MPPSPLAPPPSPTCLSLSFSIWLLAESKTVHALKTYDYCRDMDFLEISFIYCRSDIVQNKIRNQMTNSVYFFIHLQFIFYIKLDELSK